MHLRTAMLHVWAATLLVAGSSPSVQASSITFPTNATTTTQAKAYVNNNTTLAGDVTEGTTASNASITAGANNGSASVDLTTGELKAFGTSTAGFQSIATGWEFLTFSGDGSVDFSFVLDGSLRNFNSQGAVGVSLSAFLFDVTTWADYFATDFDGNTYLTKDGGETPFPYLVGSFGNYYDATGVRGLSANAANCALYFNSCIVDQVGTVIDAGLSIDSSYTVQADHLYLLQLSLVTETVNQLGIGPSQIGDFAHTATFTFTNLNGLTVESASGEFLADAAATPVPEPASLLLFGSGLSAVVARRWRNRTTSR